MGGPAGHAVAAPNATPRAHAHINQGGTGFVRLKNSWGRGWADEGQALISIADLSAMIDLESSLLPIR